MLLKAVQLSYPYLFQILMIVKRPLTDNVTGKLHTTFDNMKRLGFRSAFVSTEEKVGMGTKAP